MVFFSFGQQHYPLQKTNTDSCLLFYSYHHCKRKPYISTIKTNRAFLFLIGQTKKPLLFVFVLYLSYSWYQLTHTLSHTPATQKRLFATSTVNIQNKTLVFYLFRQKQIVCNVEITNTMNCFVCSGQIHHPN